MFLFKAFVIYTIILMVKSSVIYDNDELNSILESNTSYILTKSYTINMTLWSMKSRDIENVKIEGDGQNTLILLYYERASNYSFINSLKKSHLINIYFSIMVDDILSLQYVENEKPSLIISRLCDCYIYNMHVLFQPEMTFTYILPLINEVYNSTIIHFGLYFKTIKLKEVKEPSKIIYSFLIYRIENNEINEISGLFLEGDTLLTDKRDIYFLVSEISNSKLSYSFVNIINITVYIEPMKIVNYAYIGSINNTLSTMVLYKSFFNIDYFDFIFESKYIRNSFVYLINKCSNFIISGCWVRINYIKKYLGINSVIQNVIHSQISILNSYSHIYQLRNDKDDVNRIIQISNNTKIIIHNSLVLYNYKKYRIYKLVSYNGQLYQTEPYYTSVFSNFLLNSFMFIYETELVYNLHLYLTDFSYYAKSNTICYIYMAKYYVNYVNDRWNTFMNADIMIIEKNVIEYRFSGPVYAFTETFDYMNDWSKYYRKKNFEYSLLIIQKNNRDLPIHKIIIDNTSCIIVLSNLQNFSLSNNILKFKFNTSCKSNVIYSTSLRCFDKNNMLLQILQLKLDLKKKNGYLYDEMNKNDLSTYLGMSFYIFNILIIFCCMYKTMKYIFRDGWPNELIYERSIRIIL